VWIERFRKRPNGLAPRSLSQLVLENPALATLLARYGYAPQEKKAVSRLLESLKSLIRTDVTDFPAFREALRAAFLRERDVPRYEVGDRQLLAAAFEAGDDDDAVLAVLNRNPIYEHVPFVERVPVMRRGEIIWLTPVNHACILKRPADPIKFARLLDELEGRFHDPHPARNDRLRSQVVEAIERLRRELKRERAYFPTGIRFLETRIAEYESESLEPQARASLETLTGIFERMELVRSTCGASSRVTETDRHAALRTAREAASQYLSDPRLWNPWMTNYLAEILLSPALLETSVRRSRGARQTAALIRSEIASGFYDAEEIVRRIRRLEERGLFVSSVVYALLAMGKNNKSAPRRG
jgi:hypothetical protein